MNYRLFLLAAFMVSFHAHALTLDRTPVPGCIAVIALPDNVDASSARYRYK